VLVLGFPRSLIQREQANVDCQDFCRGAGLSAISAMPVQAQQAMSEPAYCAFFYPNANCQNKGPGNPYTDPNCRRNGGLSSGQWSGATDAPAWKKTRRSSNASARR
jgi:hypothetical protein